MSLHKLSAGSGYDYLTRQVAALDATEKGHVGLASYYTERGETPGAWIGSGLVGIDGLNAGDPVTAEQMRALFGAGMHPLAAQRLEQLGVADLTDANIKSATRLGAPFKVYAGEVSPFRVEVAKRIATRQAAGQLADESVSAALRAQVRTEVAREFFRTKHGRDPIDAREIAATIAKQSRPRTQTVAGYDLTFSPVKSVSTLWAVADPHVAAQIERAHQAAVQDALTFIEGHALFTRQGRNGVRQVNVRGLVATAFTHRDSRAGDPDLHTHVAVANKVQTLDGRWLSIDGRVLFKATVAASETYNTALEHHLHDRLGVRFADRPDTDPGKRPVREIVGVDPALNQRWSTRRVLIKVRQGELAARFQRDHGRPPTPIEAVQLAQQATLETRDAKHEPRRLAEQRATWYAQAAETLGGPHAVQAMINRTFNPISMTSPLVDAEWVSATAEKVLAAVEEHRSTWQSWHVRAEAQRQVRAVQVPTDKVEQLVELLVTEVLQTRSVALTRTDDGITEPAVLRRVDGSSVYTVAGSDLFTSARILAAEQRLVTTAGRTDGRVLDAGMVELALLESAANGNALDAGQAALVRAMCTSGARLQLAIAPAGAGKTTAMRTLARAWRDSGGQVIGLAPSAAAAALLRDATGAPADTLAKLTWSIHQVTGEESRQQLYTMGTRGRSANHIYVSVVGDGDPHTLIRPDTILPSTATELLEQILARDGSPTSASTLLREQQDPAVQLGTAVERYLDALHMAAENLIGASAVQAVEASANRLLPGLSDEPAWPTLRGHLLLLAAAGADPVAELLTAAAQWDLTSVHDQAAVIDSRIHDVNQVTAGGPLPWLPGIPHRLAADPNWGPYLNARSQLVAERADQVRSNAAAEAPAWAAVGHALVPAELIADLQVWRAATQVDPNDLRPTGPPQLGRAARIFQQQLDKRLARGHLRRPAVAATSCHRSPQRHRRPIPARTRGKVDQPHPGWFRRHPPPAVGGRRSTPTRRPPRRSPLVAHPRPATANAEPTTRNP